MPDMIKAKFPREGKINTELLQYVMKMFLKLLC